MNFKPIIATYATQTPAGENVDLLFDATSAFLCHPQRGSASDFIDGSDLAFSLSLGTFIPDELAIVRIESALCDAFGANDLRDISQEDVEAFREAVKAMATPVYAAQVGGGDDALLHVGLGCWFFNTPIPSHVVALPVAPIPASLCFFGESMLDSIGSLMIPLKSRQIAMELGVRVKSPIWLAFDREFEFQDGVQKAYYWLSIESFDKSTMVRSFDSVEAFDVDVEDAQWLCETFGVAFSSEDDCLDKVAEISTSIFESMIELSHDLRGQDFPDHKVLVAPA